MAATGAVDELELSRAASPAAADPDGDLSRFVPLHVRQLYNERAGAPLEAPLLIRREFAVVALADVSGYSLLTNTLRARGNQGAEVLTQLLNPYFHFVIDIIEKSGGDVVKFIGDAILVKWDQRGRSREETLATACWGCLRLLERLGSHILTIPDEEKTFPLSMHIGLGAGSVYDMHVGSPKYGRWEYFVDGEAIQEALKLVNIARQKELAVSDRVALLLQDEAALLQGGVTVKLDQVHAGYIVRNLTWLGADEAMLSTSRERGQAIPAQPVYRMYINESAVERLLTGHIGMINELRNVTVIFARFDPGPDSDERRAKCQTVLVGTLDVLHAYEGTLRQMVTDDKGTSLLTVFGLPPWSHENDALFGVRAALEIRKLFESLFADWAIAVTTGTLFTGIVGGRTRADHTIMGEVVNSAARLMISDMCRNQLMCDKETRDACYKEVICDEKSIEFKTKKGTTMVHHVIGLPASTKGITKAVMGNARLSMHRSSIDRAMLGNAGSRNVTTTVAPTGMTDLIGREEELAILEAALYRYMNEGSTQRIIIDGAGGTGKTALLKTFIDEAAVSSGVPCCLGKGDEVDQSTPLFSFRDIVADLLDLVLDAVATEDAVPTPSPTPPLTADTNDESTSSSGSVNAGVQVTEATPDASPAPVRRGMPQTGEMARITRAAGGQADRLLPGSPAPGSTSGRSRSLYQSMRLSPPALEKFMAHPDINGDGSVGPDSRGPELGGPAVAVAAAGAAVPPSPLSSNLAKGDAGDVFLTRIRSALARLKMDETQAPLLAQVYAMPEHARQMAAGNEKRNRAAAAAAAADGNGGGGEGDAAVGAVEATMLGLDLGGRFDALADVIASLINRVTGAQAVVEAGTPTGVDNLAAEPLLPHGLILAVDDAQWLDTMSWTLLGYLARRCPRVMLLLALRRFGRTSADSLMRIESMPECTTITLTGLSPLGVSALVARIYGDNVVSVHERLLDNIMGKTGGNPLFVEHMAVAMKGQRYLAVTGTGELFFKPKQNASELDALFPRDLQSAMLVQFDRLPADLQLILRVASVIGQNFNLEIVAKLIQRDKSVQKNAPNAEVCLKKLSENEAAAFVVPALAHTVDRALRFNFVFKSAMLQKCVYSTMLYTQREKFHQQAALLYEYQMTSDNRAQLLPLIHYHYERTHNIIKRIEYLELVAEMHMANNSYADAAASLKKLLNTLSILDVSKRTLYSTNRRAVWHKNLGIAYVNTNDWVLGQSHLMEALRLLEFPGPTTRKELQAALIKQTRRQQKYWTKRNEERTSEIKDAREMPRIRMLCEILASLHDALMYTGQADMAQWAVLTRLNLCESLGVSTCIRFGLHFSQAEGATALAYFLAGKQALALEYFQRAESLARRSNDPQDLTSIYLARAVAQFAAGEARQAYRSLDTFNAVADVAGYSPRRPDADLFFSVVSLLSGRVSHSFTRAKRCYDEASDHGEESFATSAAAAMAATLLLAPAAHGDENQASLPASWIRVLAMADPSTESMGINSAIFVTGALGLYNAYKDRISLLPGQLEVIHRVLLHTPLMGTLHLPLVGIFFVGLALMQWYDKGYPIDPSLYSVLAGGETQRSMTSSASTPSGGTGGGGRSASSSALGGKSPVDALGQLPTGGSLSLSGQPSLLFPSLRDRRSSLPNSMRSEKSLRGKTSGGTTSGTKGRRQSIQSDAEFMSMSVLGLPPANPSPLSSATPSDSPRTSMDGRSSVPSVVLNGTTSAAVAAYVGTLTNANLSAVDPRNAHRRQSSSSSTGSGAGGAAGPSSQMNGVIVPLAITATGGNSSPPSALTAEDLPSPVSIFGEYVRAVLIALKPLRRTWVLSNTLYLLFQALELLPKHGRSDKTAALLQKAALAVPEGMPLLKTILLTRCIYYSPNPTNRKAVVDRHKLLDNTLGLARQIGLDFECAALEQAAAAMDSAAAASGSTRGKK